MVSRNRYIRVEASIDGQDCNRAWLHHHLAFGGGALPLGRPPSGSPCGCGCTPTTRSHAQPGCSCRVSLNTKTYRLFVFQTKLPSGSFNTLADDLQNPLPENHPVVADQGPGCADPLPGSLERQYRHRSCSSSSSSRPLREPDRTREGFD